MDTVRASSQSFDPFDPSGTVKIRVPKGGYLLNTGMYADPADFTKGADWIAQPKLSVTKDTTVTLDAREAKPVDITVPSADAKPFFASPDYTVDTARGSYSFGWWLDSYTDFRTAHLGPQVTDGSLHQQWGGHWTKGEDAEYDTVLGGKVKQVATGYTKHFKASELATVKVDLGAAAKGKKGTIGALGYLPGSSGGSSINIAQPLPGTRTLYLSTADDVKWGMNFEQQSGVDPDGWPIIDATYSLGAPQKFAGGKSYEKRFNTAVFGPRIGGEYGVTRQGNEIGGYLPLFADGKTHAGSSLYSSVKTTLHKGSTKIGENEDPLAGGATFKVPAADAAYKLSTSVKRSVKVAAASTRIDASWTFRSKKADSAKLPVSTARFNAAVDLSSRAEAGETQSVPVTVQGAAAGSNLKSLAAYVSYDYGQTWKKATVSGGKIKVKNPAAGKGISFHAKITDKKGNKSTLSIYNAFYGK